MAVPFARLDPRGTGVPISKIKIRAKKYRGEAVFCSICRTVIDDMSACIDLVQHTVLHVKCAGNVVTVTKSAPSRMVHISRTSHSVEFELCLKNCVSSDEIARYLDLPDNVAINRMIFRVFSRFMDDTRPSDWHYDEPSHTWVREISASIDKTVLSFVRPSDISAKSFHLVVD